MKHQLTYLSSFLIFSMLLMSLSATAQKKKVIEEEPDTLPLFRGVEVTYNLGGTILRYFNSYGEYEATAKVNLKDKFFPTVEVGYGSSNHETDEVTGIHAEANAPYFRIGCDYNIAKHKHDRYRVFAGLRYGFTTFDFKCDANVADPIWGGESQFLIDEKGLSYHWAEILFGVSARLWGPVRLGWTIRYKMPITSNEGNSGNLWYIPGFGEQGNKIGATFDVGIEI